MGHGAHGQVKCVECHDPPGKPRTLVWKTSWAMSQVVKDVTRTCSSRPFADVGCASCLRFGRHEMGAHEDFRIRAEILEEGCKFCH